MAPALTIAEPTLDHEIEASVNTALERQIEHLLYQFDHDIVTTVDECRDAVQEWHVDETLIMNLCFEQRLALLEEYGDELGFTLEDVTLDTLRRRIEVNAATIVGFLAEQHALGVVEAIAELLDDLGLDLDVVKSESTYCQFVHHAERDEDPWYVYEYRYLEGEEVHLDLYEYAVADARIYVEHWLQHNDLSETEIYDARYERLRTWSQDGFRLELYDTARVDSLGKSILAYEFYDEQPDASNDSSESRPVLRGTDFTCSPLHAIDSDATVASLLSFLSLRPGDTDAEHFHEYTAAQLEWCQQRGEELGLLAEELRDRSETAELFRQGMRQAEHDLGDEVRDYDRILAGLCRVLSARGLTMTSMELHEEFHDPLVMQQVEDSVENPVEVLAEAMHRTVVGPSDVARKPTWDQEQILKGSLAPYRRWRPLDELLDERSLKKQRREITDALDSRPEFRGTLANRLVVVRRDAQRIRRRTAIVEALLRCETEGIRAQRAFAEQLEQASDRMEEQLRGELQEIEQRLVDLPRERAERIRPIRELRLKPSIFEHNQAEPDSRFVTDGALMVPKAAIRRQDRADKLSGKTRKTNSSRPEPERLSDETCTKTFEKALERATQDAKLLGWFEHEERDLWKEQRIIRQRLAVAVTADDEAVYLDADRVRLIDSLVGGFDALKVLVRAAGPAARNPERRGAYDAAVFFRTGTAVAVLMPLRSNHEDIPFDVSLARAQQEQMPAERQLLLRKWLELGRAVPWMHMAKTPPFDEHSFIFCSDVEELTQHLLRSERHALGVAFAMGDICCINLMGEPRDTEEWLLIKGGTVLGNVPLRIRDVDAGLDREATAQKVREVVALLQTATEEQCQEEDFVWLV